MSGILPKVICGIDASTRGTALTFMTLDDELNPTSIKYRAFGGSKKIVKDSGGDIVQLPNVATRMERRILTRNIVRGWLQEFSPTYVSIEEYAFAANGRVFDLAENAGLIKADAIDSGALIRRYAISQLKKLATGHGSAKKVHDPKSPKIPDMLAAFAKVFESNSMIYDGQYSVLKMPEHPREDIVDSYYVAELLRLELRHRFGFDSMVGNVDLMWCFNHIMSEYDLSLLNCPFDGEGLRYV